MRTPIITLKMINTDREIYLIFEGRLKACSSFSRKAYKLPFSLNEWIVTPYKAFPPLLRKGVEIVEI